MARYRRIYVYILLCADGTYYTGVTNDLERRLNEHNWGIDKEAYTYSRRPLQLKFYEAFDSALKGIEFEKRVKKWSKAKKEALINENWDRLKELSICKNETHYSKNARTK